MRIIIIIMIQIVGTPLLSFQGIWLPAFGAGQAGVAGAFYDPNGSPLDLEENPAMLTRLKGSATQFSIAVNRADIRYQDRYYDPVKKAYYSNKKDFMPIAPLPAFGFARNDGRFAYGLAIYVQGGGGGEFNSLQRPFIPFEPDLQAANSPITEQYNQLGPSNLARESLKVEFAFLKATPGIAFKTGIFRFGIAADGIWARMSMDRKNETLGLPVALPGGIHYRSDDAFAMGGKIGFGIDISPSLATSFSYGARNRFYLDGNMRTDSYSPVYQGNAEVSRYMQWPDRAVAGLEYKFSTYRFVMDTMYTRWSDAFGNSDFNIDRPLIYTPLRTYSPIVRMKLGWKDQLAISAGFENSIGKWRFRGGYSYAPTPQSPENLNPLLGTTVTHHFFAGSGYFLDSGEESITQFDIAIQYSPPGKMKGIPGSDWWTGHAIQDDPVHASYFEYSKTTSVFSIYLGIIHRNVNI